MDWDILGTYLGAQPERDKRDRKQPPEHRAKENCYVRFVVEKREPILGEDNSCSREDVGNKLG